MNLLSMSYCLTQRLLLYNSRIRDFRGEIIEGFDTHRVNNPQMTQFNESDVHSGLKHTTTVGYHPDDKGKLVQAIRGSQMHPHAKVKKSVKEEAIYGSIPLPFDTAETFIPSLTIDDYNTLVHSQEYPGLYSYGEEKKSLDEILAKRNPRNYDMNERKKIKNLLLKLLEATQTVLGIREPEDVLYWVVHFDTPVPEIVFALLPAYITICNKDKFSSRNGKKKLLFHENECVKDYDIAHFAGLDSAGQNVLFPDFYQKFVRKTAEMGIDTTTIPYYTEKKVVPPSTQSTSSVPGLGRQAALDSVRKQLEDMTERYHKAKAEALFWKVEFFTSVPEHKDALQRFTSEKLERMLQEDESFRNAFEIVKKAFETM